MHNSTVSKNRFIVLLALVVLSLLTDSFSGSNTNRPPTLATAASVDDRTLGIRDASDADVSTGCDDGIITGKF